MVVHLAEVNVLPIKAPKTYLSGLDAQTDPHKATACAPLLELTSQIQTLTTQISQLGQGHAAVPLVQARLDRLQQLLTSRVNSGNFN